MTRHVYCITKLAGYIGFYVINESHFQQKVKNIISPWSECSPSESSVNDRNNDLPKSVYYNNFTDSNSPNSKWILEYDYHFRNPKWTYECLSKGKGSSKMYHYPK